MSFQKKVHISLKVFWGWHLKLADLGLLLLSHNFSFLNVSSEGMEVNKFASFVLSQDVLMEVLPKFEHTKLAVYQSLRLNDLLADVVGFHLEVLDLPLLQNIILMDQIPPCLEVIAFYLMLLHLIHVFSPMPEHSVLHEKGVFLLLDADPLHLFFVEQKRGEPFHQQRKHLVTSKPLDNLKLFNLGLVRDLLPIVNCSFHQFDAVKV